MKKFVGMLTTVILTVSLAACGGGQTKEPEVANTPDTPEVQLEEIHVVTREDGSGTRSAFTELTGVLVEEGEEEIDKTLETAQVSPSTNEVMTFVAGDPAAIGYISLGSLNDTVKAINVDGVAATPEDIMSGDYKIARPFNICYKEDTVTDLTKDFISYIMSSDGQAIISEKGYIEVSENGAYEKAADLEGKITIQGSTSVTPVMEKLIEGYNKIQEKVVIEITSNGSSAGVKAAIAGQADIGMASRELKDAELQEVKGLVIAQDGIAVIVNNDNPCGDLTMEQIRQIFVGELTNWTEI